MSGPAWQWWDKGAKKHMRYWGEYCTTSFACFHRAVLLSFFPFALCTLPYLCIAAVHLSSLVVAISQRPTVLNWQQLLEPFQDIHAFLLPCHSSAEQLHGHLYIICYAGCVDQCCRALPIHILTSNVCAYHSICWPQLNVQECWCRLCRSGMCPLSVMYVHTAWWHPYLNASYAIPVVFYYGCQSVHLPKTTQASRCRNSSHQCRHGQSGCFWIYKQ